MAAASSPPPLNAPAPERAPEPARKPRGLSAGDAPAPMAPPAQESKPAGGPLAGLLKGVKPLIEREAEALREDLENLVSWLTDSADDILSHTNKRGVQADIWALDDEELTAVVDWLIERGKRTVAAAYAVRQMVQIWQQYQIGVILAPRVWRTALFYSQYGLGLYLGIPIPEDELPENVAKHAKAGSA